MGKFSVVFYVYIEFVDFFFEELFSVTLGIDKHAVKLSFSLQ